MELKIISGNLLDATETYLCHQTNCVTKVAAHCAKAVFDRFPYANVYKDRDMVHDEPGTIVVRGNGVENRFIINMMGQIYPGRPKFKRGIDSAENREKYFRNCLDSMQYLQGSFAFPYIIGCGAAGGNPVRYLEMLNNFAEVYDKNIVLYRLEQ